MSGWIKKLSPVKISETETITMKEHQILQKKIRELELESEIFKKDTAIFTGSHYLPIIMTEGYYLSFG